MGDVYKIYHINKVNRNTYSYKIFIEIIQVFIELLVAGILFFLLVPQYISQKMFWGILFIIIVTDIVESLVSIIRLKSNYFTYDKDGNFIVIFEKDFFSRTSYVALNHIKYLAINQNIFQKKYHLVDIIISTGVTKHKFQSLSESDANIIKDELGRLMIINEEIREIK